MKKIHISESQYNELRKKISEQSDAYPVDMTDSIEKANGNVSTAFSNFNSEHPQQGADLKSGKATATINPNAVTNESIFNGHSYTKKQIKEAKLRKLKENCQIFTKSDIVK